MISWEDASVVKAVYLQLSPGLKLGSSIWIDCCCELSGQEQTVISIFHSTGSLVRRQCLMFVAGKDVVLVCDPIPGEAKIIMSTINVKLLLIYFQRGCCCLSD